MLTPTTFRHEALFYAGADALVDAVLPFLRESVEAGEPALVVLGGGKLARLRAALGADAEHVRFADMASVGANPARIIPAWRDFVDEHPGRRLRGIGEPIWAARSPAEMAECHRHEALLNVAFADTLGFWLLCPYDTTTLDPGDVRHACLTHPHVAQDGARRESDGYPGLEAHAAPFADPLPPPGAEPERVEFDLDTLGAVRRIVTERAARAGLDAERAEDLLLAVHEIAGNSVRHGGGTGVLDVWEERDTLLCEISDRGRIESPLIGRQRPELGQIGGYGVWLANQLCDLVQVRTLDGGNHVRMHMRCA